MPEDCVRCASIEDVKIKVAELNAFDSKDEVVGDAQSAPLKDWTKLNNKAKLAEFARETHGFDLDPTQSMKNIQQQFIAALSANLRGEDVSKAIADQVAAAAPAK